MRRRGRAADAMERGAGWASAAAWRGCQLKSECIIQLGLGGYPQGSQAVWGLGKSVDPLQKISLYKLLSDTPNSFLCSFNCTPNTFNSWGRRCAPSSLVP